MKKIVTFRQNSTIVIKGARYKIKWKKNLRDDSDNECLGLHDCENKTISLSKDMDVCDYVPVFLHEMFHAYLFECNIREGINLAVEEIIVEASARAIDLHFDLSWKK